MVILLYQTQYVFMSKTLIYIIGTGRSGTTLLDILLGNADDAISLGEINRFFKRNGIPPKREKSSEVYRFWENIRVDIEGDENYNYRLYDAIFKKNEYHLNFLKSIFKKNSNLYKETLRKQYHTLYQRTQKKILIESSKYPARALNISSYVAPEEMNIKFIYLKKDPVKVVESFNKKNLEQPPKGFFLANIYYLSVNLLCITAVKFLKFKRYPVSNIKYEDLINHPESTLSKISKDLDIDLSNLIRKLKTNQQLETGFLFDGNRIRLKETITLRTSHKDRVKGIRYYFTRMFNYIVYR